MPSEVPPHPFVDNGRGFPTEASARAAFTMFNLDRIADLQVRARGHVGTMVGLVAQCEITHLTTNWPHGFIGQVVGIAAEAGRGSRG